MINDDTIRKIYEGIINGEPLTTKTLNNYSFTSKELSDLIEMEILTRVKRGHYSLATANFLYVYGKELYSLKEYDKAYKCFEKCYEIDPNHMKANLSLFINCIFNENYEKAFQHFKVLQMTKNPIEIANNKLYLHLLNIITDIPAEYKETVTFVKKNIQIMNSPIYDRNLEYKNKIRALIMSNKFSTALEVLNNLIEVQKFTTVSDKIIKLLLGKASEVNTNKKRKLLYLVTNKDYDLIIEYLTELENKHFLNITDQYVLKLSRKISEIKKYGIIPIKYGTDIKTVFDAIDTKNYEIALKLANDYYEKNSAGKLLCMLLDQINMLIQDISNTNKKSTQPKENIKKEIILSEVNKETSMHNSVLAIVSRLKSQDLSTSFTLLRSYLNDIGKSQYETFIIYLMKISLYTNDHEFEDIFKILTDMNDSTFVLDASIYTSLFYDALSKNKFEIANIYWDIVSKEPNHYLGPICQEKSTTSISSKETLPIERPISNISSNTEEKLAKKPGMIHQTKQIYSESPKKDDNDMIEIVKGQAERLSKEDGIIILNPMNGSQRKAIHEMANNIPSIKTFSIGTDPYRRVVLKYKEIAKSAISNNDLNDRGKQEYANKQYRKFIDTFLELLTHRDKPSSFVFNQLGLAYMLVGNKRQALKYLTVAGELEQLKGGGQNTAELILNLQGIISMEDKKNTDKIYMKISEFQNDLSNNYGIEQIEKIKYLIINNGASIEDACISFGLNDEQIKIVKLMIAKIYYAQNSYAWGDYLLKDIESSKNNTKYILKLLNEVKVNKLFYKNRLENKDKGLVLKTKASIKKT